MIPKKPVARQPTASKQSGAETPRSKPDEAEATSIEALSFKPLMGTASPRNGARVSLAFGSTPPRTPDQSATPRGFSKTPGDGDRRVRPVISPPRHLIAACGFAAGVAATVAGYYLVRSDLLFGTNPPGGAPARIVTAGAARTGAEGLSSAEASSVSARSIGQRFSRDPEQANERTKQAEDATFAMLMTRFEHQLIEGHLDQPVDDNALVTYRKLSEIGSKDPKAREIGDRLSTVFWSLAKHAQAKGQFDDAVHYFGILETLPPVPVAAILSEDDGPTAVADTAAAVDPPSTSFPEAAANSSSFANPASAVAADSVAASPVPPAEDGSGETMTSRDVAGAGLVVTPTRNPEAIAPEAEAIAPEELYATAQFSTSFKDDANRHGDISSVSPDSLAQAGQAIKPTAVISDAAPTPVDGSDANPRSSSVAERAPNQDASKAPPDSREVANLGTIDSSPSKTVTVSPQDQQSIVAVAMARGDEAFARGDVISARHFYEFAASKGIAQAAAAVGRTYDPTYLRARGIRGPLADAGAAKRWYQRAIGGGEAAAHVPLDRLLTAEKGNAGR